MLVPLGVVLAVVTAIVVVHPWTGASDDSQTLADGATVSASSTALGYAAASAVVGRTSMPSQGWRSDGQTVGAWLSLAWPTPRRVHSVSIERPVRSQPGVTRGMLTFGDGSAMQVVLATASRTTTVPVTARDTRSVRFTATGVSSGAQAVTLDRFAVNASDSTATRDAGGDAAAHATITASSGGEASALADGAGGWSTASPEGTTIRFDWTAPRELAAIVIAGAAGSTATIASATLRLSGGGSVPIGGVPADSSLPTTVAFLPYAVRSATLTIDRVTGSGRLGLSSIRLVEQGADAARLKPTGGPEVTAPAAAGCADVAAPSSTASLQVLCPGNGSRVGDEATLVVAVPRGTIAVTADVWPATGSSSVPTVTVTGTGTGAVRVPLQLAALPAGPVTVLLTAVGAPGAAVRLQLLHGREPTTTVPSSAAARGRTLVYDEEFDGPVSFSPTGDGARYASAKPETAGVSDFGDAVFADPSAGLGNIGVLDDHYLRIDASPKPSGFTDPRGSGRSSVGGLLASARPGGSGFSAQYGYFEARMLVPAAPGTWPAFWLLPSTNLVSPQKAVAELDAVELYGHDPQGACQSTHQYVDGKDGGVADCGSRFPTARDAAQWHTYGIDVTPTQVVFFIDGRRVATAPQVRGGGEPMFFLADLALGGGWPVDLSGTRGRAQLLIDSIRVYV